MAQVKDIPDGYCDRVHLIRYRPTLKKGKSIVCACCKTSFQDNNCIFTCHCATFFACSKCLTERKTFSPPPNCPNLSCTGKCTLRYKGIITICYQCKAEIPREIKFWNCSLSPCRSIICVNCVKRDAPVNDSAQSASIQESPPIPNSAVPFPPCSPQQPSESGQPAPALDSDGH